MNARVAKLRIVGVLPISFIIENLMQSLWVHGCGELSVRSMGTLLGLSPVQSCDRRLVEG